MGTPVLDATTAQVDFRLPVQVNNSLLNNSGGGSINTNDAFIQTFEMTYSGAALPPWSVSTTVTVPAAGSAGALLRLIPVQYFPAILPSAGATTSIVVNVRGHGVLTSQALFTTAWYQVPVTVCAGCLAVLTCPAGSILATCPLSAPGATSPGQTANVACIAGAP
ncbi:MAG: hypothetical protein WB493_01640 [Anaeromyxobacteraceae bacterium]